VIEVYADIVCPFTHVGLRRLVSARKELGRDDVVIRIRAWPLELVNGAPLASKLVVEEVGELRDHVATGLFAGLDARTFPSTSLPALALAAVAYRQDPATGEAVSLALRDALFERGLDVSDRGVLAAIAEEHATHVPGPEGEELVRSEWAEGRARGVIGSPHFFVSGRDFFCPALDIKRVDGHLRITADIAGFAEFVASCFA